MDNKAKKITAIIVIAFFVFAFIFPLLANLFAKADQLNDIGQKKQQTQGQINKIKNTNSDILAQKKKADEITRLETLARHVAGEEHRLVRRAIRRARLDGQGGGGQRTERAL